MSAAASLDISEIVHKQVPFVSRVCKFWKVEGTTPAELPLLLVMKRAILSGSSQSLQAQIASVVTASSG